MKKRRFTIEQLELAVKESKSIANVCRLIGLRPVGGNYKTIKYYIKLYKFDNSHFTGQGWNLGTRTNKVLSMEEILIENSSFTSSSKLREKLISQNFKNHECEICKNTEWMGKLIKLELHHINGINTDNRLENLQILCPNCHSYTDNFRGKGIKKSALSEKKEVEYRKFREALTVHADGNPEPSLFIKEGAETLHGKPKVKISKFKGSCISCNKEVSKTGNKYCSYECLRNDMSSRIPSKEDILKAFEQHHSFLQVANYFNVSDNAIRKWCIKKGILTMVKRKSRPQTV